ncbi:MAG: GDP-mannose 4,6-dehydratase [Epsilonproteobacteria bacterium]|nr:GDP-mannose 4,6-dehydratase [Campylobacterota bacterium]
MATRAIVTGVFGQDGSYLAEFLLGQGYEVYGVYRRCIAHGEDENVAHLKNHQNFKLVESDILEYSSLTELISDTKPEFFFNLAAQSHVGYSFKVPIETFRVDAEAVIAQLDIIRRVSPKTRYYQASTSEMFGGIDCPKHGYTEQHPLNPCSPYAVAKVAAHHAVKNYRQAYGLFACSGILFNHSSPRRGYDFATRKITHGVAQIVAGKQQYLPMGNMDAFRDEGHAKDYVKAQYLMLMQDKADDYVVATGDGATIRQMLEYVCQLAGLAYDDVYRMNPEFMRPSDVPFLLGDSSKIRSIGWQPEYDWKKLLKEMFEHDCSLQSSANVNSLQIKRTQEFTSKTART